MNYSTTYTATVVLILTSIANIFSIEVVSDELTVIVSASLTILSGMWIIIERYRKGGLSAFGFRVK